jgi:hypothetical protein
MAARTVYVVTCPRCHLDLGHFRNAEDAKRAGERHDAYYQRHATDGIDAALHGDYKIRITQTDPWRDLRYVAISLILLCAGIALFEWMRR